MSAATAAREGALADVRVIEMGTMIAGPFCGQLLADHGAEVVKLEQPGVGDPMRQWGKEKPHGKALFWQVLSRNKLSATVNAREPEGQALVRELAADADVLLENFRPGTMERWGLGYEELSAANPRLVMVRVSGFGQTGPYAGRAGYGAIGEAMGGLRYTTGDPSLPPSRAGISIGDSLAAIHACLGATMALHQARATGRGQVVDASIYESVLNVMESLVIDYDVGGYVRERTGSFLPRIAPSNVYPTKDGIWIVVGANQDSVWARMAAAMDRPELASDERYATHGARGANQEELDALIAGWTAGFDAAALEARLNEHGIPNGKIYRAPEMLADPQFKARGSIVRVRDPDLGEVAMQNVAPRLSRTPGGVRHPGPALGEHNGYVWGELAGKSPDEMRALRDCGVI